MLKIDNILNIVFEKFPRIIRRENYSVDELLPYNVLGDFALEFQQKFLNSKITTQEVEKFFDFVNQMSESSDVEVQNIFVVEILAILSDKQETINLAMKMLHANGKKMFYKLLRGEKFK